MINADLHVHSEFSSDCSVDIEQQIKKAIKLGLKFICLTDHYDMDYPSTKDKTEFALDTTTYMQKLSLLKEKYKDKINVLCGVELGLMPYLKNRIKSYTQNFNFDFIIGSSHLVNGKDPILPNYFCGRDEKTAYREYFESILDNVKIFDEYNVYGHLDYIVRYGPNKNKFFDFSDYKDIFEQALKIIIENGKGIEINTAGLRKELGYPHPHKDILQMYKELGGDIITIGSDAHLPEHIGYMFEDVKEYLKSIGFD